MAGELHCWRCGASLAALPLPFGSGQPLDVEQLVAAEHVGALGPHHDRDAPLLGFVPLAGDHFKTVGQRFIFGRFNRLSVSIGVNTIRQQLSRFFTAVSGFCERNFRVGAE